MAKMHGHGSDESLFNVICSPARWRTVTTMRRGRKLGRSSAARSVPCHHCIIDARALADDIKVLEKTITWYGKYHLDEQRERERRNRSWIVILSSHQVHCWEQETMIIQFNDSSLSLSFNSCWYRWLLSLHWTHGHRSTTTTYVFHHRLIVLGSRDIDIAVMIVVVRRIVRWRRKGMISHHRCWCNNGNEFLFSVNTCLSSGHLLARFPRDTDQLKWKRFWLALCDFFAIHVRGRLRFHFFSNWHEGEEEQMLFWSTKIRRWLIAVFSPIWWNRRTSMSFDSFFFSSSVAVRSVG